MQVFWVLDVFEDGVPPRFRLHAQTGPALIAQDTSIETVRPDGTRQLFTMQGPWRLSGIRRRNLSRTHSRRMCSTTALSTPPFFRGARTRPCRRDNNIRAAVIHVMADAAVSVLVIMGLLLARTFGWLWMDPLAGIIGACVIASWSYGLIRDTGAILLDRNPDTQMADNLRRAVESRRRRTRRSSSLAFGAGASRGNYFSDYRSSHGSPTIIAPGLPRFKSLSHLTVEVVHNS